MRSKGAVQTLRGWFEETPLITWTRLRRWMALNEDPLEIAMLLNNSVVALQGGGEGEKSSEDQLSALVHEYVMGLLELGEPDKHKRFKLTCSSGGYLNESVAQLIAVLRNSVLLAQLSAVPGSKWTEAGYKSK